MSRIFKKQKRQTLWEVALENIREAIETKRVGSKTRSRK